MDVITEAMESFIDAFQTQLAPAAVQIVTRLVRFTTHPRISIYSEPPVQSQSYLRLVHEYVAIQGNTLKDDVTSITGGEDDKSMVLIGIAKTIETVSGVFFVPAD